MTDVPISSATLFGASGIIRLPLSKGPFSPGTKGYIQHNLGASTAPGVGDDDADKYSTGSLWYDTTANNLYICKSAATGAAAWLLHGGADLAVIEALSPSNDDILQRKSGAWANRTLAQVKDDLNNAAGKGTRVIKTYADATGVSHTGNTTKTTLATIAIPALGANDQIEVTAIGTKSGTNAAASIIIDLDGTTFHNAGTGATNVFWKHQLTIFNQGSVSSQIGSSSGVTASGNSANAAYTGTVDTSSTKNLTICVQHGGAGSDTVTLRGYSVRIIRGE